MTKVWLLYDNPFDEGDNIYGAFSTEEKAHAAHEIFSKVSKYELYFQGYKLDDLEKYFEKVKSGYQIYIGNRRRYDWSSPASYGEWTFHTAGLDSFFEKKTPDNVCELDSFVSAHITAKSEEEAQEIAEKIFNEKGEGYNAWLK